MLSGKAGSVILIGESLSALKRFASTKVAVLETDHVRNSRLLVVQLCIRLLLPAS